VATLLYTALTDLKVYSVVATWFAVPGQVLPLDPAKASTIALLANGSIVLAPPGAVDTCSPAGIVRGMPGLHEAVSN
jgi:hypothetical protein